MTLTFLRKYKKNSFSGKYKKFFVWNVVFSVIVRNYFGLENYFFRASLWDLYLSMKKIFWVETVRNFCLSRRRRVFLFKKLFFGVEYKKILVWAENIYRVGVCLLECADTFHFRLLPWCWNFVERQSFGRVSGRKISRKFVETLLFHKIFKPRNKVKSPIFEQC